MNQNPNTPGVKWVIFKDFTQFSNDSRGLLQHHSPFLPTGYPIEKAAADGTLVIAQKFEQRGPRLTFPEIHERLDKLLEIMQTCIS